MKSYAPYCRYVMYKGERVVEKIKEYRGIVIRVIACSIFLCFIYSEYIGGFRNQPENRFVLSVFFVISVAIILVTIGLYYFNYIMCVSIEKKYVFLGIVLGSFYICILPPYTVPDEKTHIDMAYQMANEIIMGEEAETGKVRTMYKRQGDIEAVLLEKPNGQVYREIYYNILKRCPNERMVETDTYGYSTMKYLHFAGAMGIMLGQYLHLSTYLMYALGRMFNGIIFIILVYWGIKKIPFGKKTLMMLALLPTTLQQANSFSYDSLLIGMSILFIAQIISIIYQNKTVRRHELALLMILSLLLALPKGGCYLPLVFLMLLIPNEKFQWKRPRIIYKIIPIIITIGGFLLFNAGALLRISEEMESGIQIAWSDGRPGYTLHEVFVHPVEYIKILLNSVWVKGGEWVESFVGGELGWFDLHIGKEMFLLFAIIFLLSILRTEEESKQYEFSWRKYLPYVLLFIMSVGLFMTIMMIQNTPAENDIIIGIQGRYFTPVILLLVLTVPIKNIILKKDNSRRLTEIIWILQVIVINRIFLQIITRL